MKTEPKIFINSSGILLYVECPVEPQELKDGRPQGYAGDYINPISGAALWDKIEAEYQSALAASVKGGVLFENQDEMDFIMRSKSDKIYIPNPNTYHSIPAGFSVEVDKDHIVIEAFGLRTRTWTFKEDWKKYGCAECCTGDHCDEDCTAKYDRRSCPHCKQTGWIEEKDVTNVIGKVAILKAVENSAHSFSEEEKDVEEIFEALDREFIRGYNKAIDDVLEHFRIRKYDDYLLAKSELQKLKK